MKRASLLAVVALGALMLLPDVALAGHRFGTDRGSRYYGGGGWHGHRSSSRSHFGFSIGFGSGGYHRGGYSYSKFHFGTLPRYHHYGGYHRTYYRPAPVVVCPPPVVYAPAPVVYAAPPVVYYSAPRPVYTSSYYYSSGYYCGR